VRTKRHLTRFARALIIAFSASVLFGLDPKLALTQYVHTNWTQRHGFALQSVKALAQTKDGYLWLGTATGLYRFDGINVVPWKPASAASLPSREVRVLLAAGDGGLWIGTAAGVSKLQGGNLKNYTSKNGLCEGFVMALIEDHRGRLWVGSAGSKASGLSVIQHDSVRTIDGNQLPSPNVLSLFEDRKNSIWIGTSKGLCRSSLDGEAACVPEIRSTVSSIAAESDGDLLIADSGARTLFRYSDGRLTPVVRSVGDASLSPMVLLRDRDDAVWLGTLGQGLLRLRNGGFERFTRRDGLSGDIIETLFEDREGNLWVGTENGLDRLRNPEIPRLSTLEGLSGDLITSVYGARNGENWIGTMGSGLNRVSGGAITHYLTGAGLPSTTVISMYEDAAGRLLVGTSGGLCYRSHDRFVNLLTKDGARADRVFDITGDGQGTVWLADQRKGLLRLRHEGLEPAHLKGLPEAKDIYQIHCDLQGVLWIGYYHGGVVGIRDGFVQKYSANEGLAPGPVYAIQSDSTGNIWIGTSGGLSRLRNGRLTTWTTKHGLPEGGVQAILDDRKGGLWLGSTNGLLKLTLGTVNSCPDGSPSSLGFSTYGPSEGIRLGSGGRTMNPRMTRSSDGVLWISTQDGVAVINPTDLGRNPVPTPVVIERMMIDRKDIPLDGPAEITFRAREVQLDYTALSFVSPETTQFRYKLEGFDSSWKEAGTRRAATYTNLSPGRYRFFVAASNNDGVWNEPGANLTFRVQPQFYRTWWFMTVCATALLLSGSGIYLLRARQLRDQFQLVLQERYRLTRDLHDTLLQGFAGFLYQVDAAWRQLEKAPEATKEKLKRALEQGDLSLKEARETLSFMRLSAVENSTLSEAIAAIGNQLTQGTPVRFTLEVKGSEPRLQYAVQANLYALAREALTNAVNHAQATQISVELSYTASGLKLAVQDDGSGFDPEVAAQKRNRFGLLGMRERAQQLNGTFAMDTAPGRGTRIDVKLDELSTRRTDLTGKSF
jgi:ligand-binding sensor domain-containing protein/signal transduction histidine kinase